MAKKYARGEEAWGECGRCAKRDYLRNLVFDGYYPNMRVCSECYEPKHPQENLKRIDDPVALWRPAPENIQNTPPVLTGVVFDGPGTGDSEVRLSWTRAYSGVSQITGYTLYRSTAQGPYVVLGDFTITRDFLGGITPGTEVLAYVDTAVVSGTHYDYFVIAHAVQGGDAQSNTVGIDFADLIYQATAPVLTLVSVDGPTHTANLSWTASTIHNGTIDHYELFRRNSPGGSFAHLANVAGLTYSDTTIAGGPGYEYYVVARVLVGLDSADSNIVITGFVFTGTIVTDMRFSDFTDSASPGLVYAVRPTSPAIDRPTIDSGRGNFAPNGANWAGGSARSDLFLATPTAAINLAGDWTVQIDLEVALDIPLGGFPVPCVFQIMSTITIRGIELQMTAYNGPLTFIVHKAGGDTSLNTTVVPALGQNKRVIATYVATTGVLNVYVDGVLKATATIASANMPTGSCGVCLGYVWAADGSADGNRFRGWLDNFRYIQGQAVAP